MANTQLADNFKIPYNVVELDSDGNVATPSAGDTCTVVSSDTTKATIVPDATPAAGSIASGFIVGGSVEGTVTVTATTTHADGTPVGPPIVDAIDVVSGAPVTAGFSLGTPVSQ
jgi:hypothetical protein